MIAYKNENRCSAIYRLREETLKAGEPFMINVEGLPKDYCYLEYPDKSIVLVNFIRNQNDFSTIEILSSTKSNLLRKQLGIAD